MGMRKFKSPALPLPREMYDRQYFDQFIRILTIYFNQLDSNTPLQAETYYGGGWKLDFPHIAASDSTDQRTINNTATVVNWNTLDSAYGWTLNSPGSATADYAGVYKITYSLQFINTDNAIHYVDVWMQVNNTDVTNSTTRFFVPARKSTGAGNEGYLCAYSEVTFIVDVGDEIELYWATNKANVLSPAADGVYMFHDAASNTPYDRPAIPSAIGSITFVSALP